MSDVYSLQSKWHLPAEPRAVMEIMEDYTAWQKWWPGLVQVEILQDRKGVGAQAWLVWRSWLGYRLRILITVTAYEPERQVTFTSQGDLAGSGSCTISSHGPGQALVDFRWKVVTTKRWMAWLEPFLRPVFVYNHHKLMRAGEQGLQRYIIDRY